MKQAQCPIARGLDQVGEWWSLLILRDAFDGFTRFDEFARNLKIAPTMLSRRLRTLVDAGLLERRRYCEHPPRFEYLLTERGREFRPVLLALYAWAYQHTSPEARSLSRMAALMGQDFAVRRHGRAARSGSPRGIAQAAAGYLDRPLPRCGLGRLFAKHGPGEIPADRNETVCPGDTRPPAERPATVLVATVRGEDVNQTPRRF